MTKSQISSSIIIIILALIMTDNTYAHERNRTESRLNQVKRTKIIEELNLSAPEKEKFIETFDQAEAKIMVERNKKHDIFKALQQAIAENKSDETIAKLSDELQTAQNSMHAAMSERQNSFKSILSKKQFGKFVLVDHKFMKDVQRSMMKYYKNCNHSGNKDDCTNAKRNANQNSMKKKSKKKDKGTKYAD